MHPAALQLASYQCHSLKMNQTNNPSAKAHLWQVALSFFYLLVFPVVLFFLSGDWRWTEGWIFSIMFFLSSFATIIYLYVSTICQFILARWTEVTVLRRPLRELLRKSSGTCRYRSGFCIVRC